MHGTLVLTKHILYNYSSRYSGFIGTVHSLLAYEFSFDSADITEEISRSLKKIAPNSETLLELIIEILYFKLLAYFFYFI